MYQSSFYDDDGVDYEHDSDNDNEFHYDETRQVVLDTQPEQLGDVLTMPSLVEVVPSTEEHKDNTTFSVSATSNPTISATATTPTMTTPTITNTKVATTEPSVRTVPSADAHSSTSAVTTDQGNNDSETFVQFHVLEQQRKVKIIQDFQESEEFQTIKENVIRTALEDLEEAKESDLAALAQRVSREGGWLYRSIPCIRKRKALLRLMYGSTPFMDLFKEFETKICKRNPLYGDFPGSVARICLEYKPESFTREGVRIPKRDGIIFKEYLNGKLGDTVPINNVINLTSTSHLVITYNDEFLIKLKGTDPFNLYEQEGFPKATLDAHTPNNGRSIPDLLPNRCRPIYNLMYPARSPNSIEFALHGPLTTSSFQTLGIPELTRCRLDIFIREFNLPRQKAMASDKEGIRIHNAQDAWLRIGEALDDPQLLTDHEHCGSPTQLRTDITTAIQSYQQELTNNITSYLIHVIHFKLTAQCLLEDIWIPELLGSPNPSPKPPMLDRRVSTVNHAFLCGLNKEHDKQMQRYDDIQVPCLLAKFAILSSNMHIALASAVNYYNEIISLLGTPFHEIITRYYPRQAHRATPQFNSSRPYYIALSGPTGFIAWFAPNVARINALRAYSPEPVKEPKTPDSTQRLNKRRETNILDHFFRMRMDLTPLNSHPLDTLGITLNPSERIKQEVKALQAQEQRAHEAQTHNTHFAHVHLESHHLPTGQPILTTSNTPQPLAATSTNTGDDFLEYFMARGRRIATSQNSNVNLAGTTQPIHQTAAISSARGSYPGQSALTPSSGLRTPSSLRHTQVPLLSDTNFSMSNYTPFNIGHRFTIREQYRYTVPRHSTVHPRRFPAESETPRGLHRRGLLSGPRPLRLGLLLRTGDQAPEEEKEASRMGDNKEADEGDSSQGTQQGALSHDAVPESVHEYKLNSTQNDRRQRARSKRKRPHSRNTPFDTSGRTNTQTTVLGCTTTRPQYSNGPGSPVYNSSHLTADRATKDEEFSPDADSETTEQYVARTRRQNSTLGESSPWSLWDLDRSPRADTVFTDTDVMSPANSLNDNDTDFVNDIDTDFVNITVESRPNTALAAMAADILNQGVNNISSVQLSVDELRVLALGLHFIPEPTDISNFEIYQALDEYTDTLLWKEHLDYTKVNTTLPSERDALSALKRRLRQKLYRKRVASHKEYQQRERGYIKSYESSQYIATIRERFKRDISDKRLKTYHQLSKEDSASIDAILWDLRNNQLIVIKPADKNLGPTVMDRTWYIQAGEMILQDESTYRAVDSFDIIAIRNELLHILATSDHLQFKRITPLEFQYATCRLLPLQELLKTHITSTTALADALIDPFLHPEDIQVCREYFIPKLHKLLLPWPRPPPLIPGQTPPVRPICAAICWVTYIVSVYLDIILKPTMLQLPSYIMNSAALVKQLEHKTFPSNCALLAADVESLYPSIDINRGLDALNNALRATNMPHNTRLFIVKLVRWVLYNNYLEFNGKLYLQIRGTAMGTPCAVVVACIFMGTIERQAWSLLTNRNIQALLDLRYIDDFVIIANSIEDAEAILKVFNEIDPLIKLTGTISSTSCNFLDLTLYKGTRFTATGTFDSDVFQKPSNQFLFLPNSSFHPEHTFRGWIQGYISRLRLNCTDDDRYLHRRQQFRSQLAARGYTEDNLSAYFEYNPARYLLLNKVALTPKQNSINTKTVFKIRFSPRTSTLLPILKNALTASPDILINPSLAKQLQPNGRPTICFRNSPNIAKTIISAKLAKPHK